MNAFTFSTELAIDSFDFFFYANMFTKGRVTVPADGIGTTTEQVLRPLPDNVAIHLHAPLTILKPVQVTISPDETGMEPILITARKDEKLSSWLGKTTMPIS